MDILLADHIDHKNPLVIHIELPDLDGREVRCIACLYPLLSGPFYSCGERDCYLHKVCAEVPLELKHPLHSDHTLTLVAGGTKFFKCMICDTISWRERMYECRPCGLRLDLECASKALRIQHECHPHPLIPLLKPALFFCYACSNEHRGVSYQCSSCYFLVHESCASMPSTLKNSHHNHPLTLSRAYVHERSKFSRFCDICHKELTMYWFYHCIGCRFYAHFSCATSKEEIAVEGEEDFLDPECDPLAGAK
ncbi:protein VACUOLELESS GAMETOPHYTES-like isoform X2 [Actinidia eriantha]|uniref:protein VACUOLELESS GAMETOPHYTES-like isoform X2 n=1 Tax=Actinidia eriantha TaxID=165200 RepID=UPI00258DF542|nr:protein VACUOLELESS GAMETOPHYTES-like isoform X2 [Actinidia eriantha]